MKYRAMTNKSTKTVDQLTEDQLIKLAYLQTHFPFRIIYGAISRDGEFEASAVTTMHRPNKLAREGWKVFTVKK